MYISDARHFLDDKGAIATLRGPAKAMAEFHGGVIAYVAWTMREEFRERLAA